MDDIFTRFGILGLVFLVSLLFLEMYRRYFEWREKIRKTKQSEVGNE